MTAPRFFTIGHSTRRPGTVVEMLRDADIGLLADVRHFPRSRRHPEFNIETFPDLLSRSGIAYRHLPALGGRRSKQQGIDPAINGFWREAGFHNYADYALGPEFAAGLAELVALAARQRVAIMCAEAVWWRCHRRIITDHLLLAGHAVTHLLSPGQANPATPTPSARRGPGGRITYPPPTEAAESTGAVE